MLLFFALAAGVLLFGVRAKPRLAFDGEYVSRERTQAMNGFFVLLVFLSHAVTYVTPADTLDTLYLAVKDYLGQLIVAPFLFFSGYGVLTSFRKTGKAYLRRLFCHRFFRILLQSEVVVLLFLLTNLCIGRRYPLRRTALAFTFWENIGNSNWYIFVVLALYLLTAAAFFAARGKLWPGALLTAAGSVLLVAGLRAAGKDAWWYNTVLLFPLGMGFGLLKDRLDACLQKGLPRRVAALGACGLAFCASSFLRGRGLPFYTLWAAAFIACVTLVMMHLQFRNRLLSFFGRHVFSIFMLQRIPLLVFAHVGLAEYRYVFVALSFAATLLLAVGFDALFQRIFPAKPKKSA